MSNPILPYKFGTADEITAMLPVYRYLYDAAESVLHRYELGQYDGIRIAMKGIYTGLVVAKDNANLSSAVADALLAISEYDRYAEP